AAHGGLKPSPTGRLRRVLLHLSYSMALSHLLDTTPPRLLPAAACGGLRSAPDPRTRRALLHLSYSCAPQTTHAALVTHDPEPTPDGKSAVGRRPPERGGGGWGGG